MTKNIPRPALRSDADGFANYALRNARIEAGYTIYKLAEKLGIYHMKYHNYERLRSFPDELTGQRIAQTLGKSIDDLFPESLREVAREINRGRKLKSTRQKEPEYIPLDQIPEGVLVSSDNPERDMDEIFFKAQLEYALKTLRDHRQVEAIVTYFGLDDSYKQNSCGSSCLVVHNPFQNISRSRRGQIREKGLEKLRHRIRAEPLRPFLN